MSHHPVSPVAAELIEAPHPAPPPTIGSFAELLFHDRDPGDDQAEVLLGTIGTRLTRITLGQLRHAAIAIIDRMAEAGIAPGDTVCLLRLPRTSETLIAVAYVALSAWGLRVLLPMYVDPHGLERWLTASQSRMLLWAEAEVLEHSKVEADRALATAVARAAAAASVPALCLERDLHVADALANDGVLSSVRVASMVARTHADTPCLLLTTSGTSGHSKLVRYRQGAFLRSCSAWEQAGLLGSEALGGRGLCLLLCHSMGIRALWNALWTRKALCLIPPEWFEEHPERVRSFLLAMRPEHVTGGPAVFRTLLELGRVFPQLKDQCFQDLKCLVSSGAGYDPSLAQRIESAFGLPLHNALGLTETQQTVSTLVGNAVPFGAGALGSPLPGVRLALTRPESNGANGASRLLISSPFASDGYLGDDGVSVPLPGPAGWFDTGDLVTRTEAGLVHAGRDEQDFFKDGFGVKVSYARIRAWYATLGPPVEHLEPFALRDEPGLGALVFLQPNGTIATDQGSVSDRAILRRIKGAIAACLERLRSEVDELEFRHLAIVRFICVVGPPPRTPKGEVSRSVVRQRHAALVARLEGRFVHGPDVERIDRLRWTRTNATRLASPRRGELLRLARLDKDYTRAAGDELTYREDGRDITVTDFVGGFGGNLLGHRHPDVLAATLAFLSSGQPPIGDQGSAHRAQGELARKLASRVAQSTGDAYVVRFGSTGAEVVEMALAHALLERSEQFNRLARLQLQQCGAEAPDEVRDCIREARARLDAAPPRVLAITSAFHGHSLAARSVLGANKRRLPFMPLSRIEPIFVPADGLVDLESIVRESEIRIPVMVRDGDQVHREQVSVSGILAAIVEPILGEGGIHEVAHDLLQRLSNFAFPLILDEIQCGLGRSGSWLASEGVRAHYYLFAKALGGGVAKVAALLIEHGRYVPKFDEYYASTFAGDPFSSTVAAAVLDIIDRDDVPARARERGEALRSSLDTLHRDYPDVIKDVRGRGLLLSVELDPACVQDSFLLRGLALHEHLGELAAAYLLNEHRIRLLPTLSAPLTLRVEPSAYLPDDAIAQLAGGLRALCDALRSLDSAKLLAFLVRDEHDGPDGPNLQLRETLVSPRIDPPPADAVRVGFVSHFVYPERELAMGEPLLASMSVTERRALFHRFMELLELEPIFGFARALMQQRIWFLFLFNTADVAVLEALHRSDRRTFAVERVQQAVDLAAAQGCTVIALGAFSSIITRNGTAITPPAGTRITSGNALTVAAAHHRILEACRNASIDPRSPNTRIGVVGATGNIGAVLCHRLTTGNTRFARVLLVSRNERRLEQLRASLAQSASDADLACSTELDALRTCNVIALTVNANAPLLYPHHLGPQRPIVVGDISVPGSVSDAVRQTEGVRVHPIASVLTLPGEPDFVMSSHSPPGTAFCCAAEAILLGLEPQATAGLRLIGDVDPACVDTLEQLAQKHGLLRAR